MVDENWGTPYPETRPYSWLEGVDKLTLKRGFFSTTRFFGETFLHSRSLFDLNELAIKYKGIFRTSGKRPNLTIFVNLENIVALTYGTIEEVKKFKGFHIRDFEIDEIEFDGRKRRYLEIGKKKGLSKKAEPKDERRKIYERSSRKSILNNSSISYSEEE